MSQVQSPNLKIPSLKENLRVYYILNTLKYSLKSIYMYIYIHRHMYIITLTVVENSLSPSAVTKGIFITVVVDTVCICFQATYLVA